MSPAGQQRHGRTRQVDGENTAKKGEDGRREAVRLRLRADEDWRRWEGQETFAGKMRRDKWFPPWEP